MSTRPARRTIAALAMAATLIVPGCTRDTGEPAPRAPRNPHLSAPIYGLTHIDSAQSDTFPYPTPRGTFHIDPKQMPRVPAGPVNIMTLASTSRDHMWLSSTQGVSYIDISGGGFRAVAQLDAPGAKTITPQALDAVLDRTFTEAEQIEQAVRTEWGLDRTRLANGVHSLVDDNNELYYVTQHARIVVFGLADDANPGAGLRIRRSLDFTPWLGTAPGPGGLPDSIAGVALTYDGMLAVLSTRGLAVLDRGLRGQPRQVRFGDDEVVANSMAIDERGGIYAASDRIMRKVVWTGSRLSADEADGAWSAPYTFGRQPPAVKFGTGTGSTPTLMGYGDDDRLVVITDGADRMNLVAFWRDRIPEGSQRLADRIPVTAGLDPQPEFIQSEQSVVVDGYGAFVVNDARPQGNPDRLVDVLAGGPVYAPPSGVQRFAWDREANRWTSAWTRGDVVSASMAPTASTRTGTVFVNGYTEASGWEVTGLDWDTGQTVQHVIFGRTTLGNGAYGLIQYLPDGDLLFNSIGGPFRAKLTG